MNMEHYIQDRDRIYHVRF